MLRIGDTLTEGEGLRFTGIPSFAPELLQRVRPDDPMRAKHLGRALEQLAEEGAAQALQAAHRLRAGSSAWSARLQFDVLADRIRTEYDLPVHFESVPYVTARWAVCDDHRLLTKFCNAHEIHIADDHTGAPVFLARNDWQLEHACDDFPGVRLLEVVQPHAAAVDDSVAV